MKTGEFINRIEAIRQKDKRYDVYFELLKLPVETVLEMIRNVDDQLFDEEIDKKKADFKAKILQKLQ